MHRQYQSLLSSCESSDDEIVDEKLVLYSLDCITKESLSDKIIDNNYIVMYVGNEEDKIAYKYESDHGFTIGKICELIKKSCFRYCNDETDCGILKIKQFEIKYGNYVYTS